ncbi:pyridoxamine 5'-phosphate oxidase family protein [Alsobacter sp. R-9]
MDEFLTDSMRALQEKFETVRLAEKVRQRAFRSSFTAADRAFIDNAMFFFLATVDAGGRPQCSYKGGSRGFVRATGDAEVTFPIFEGNGLYLSAGNIAETGRVDLLFVDFEKQARLRVNGTARIDDQHPMLGRVRAAQLFIRVAVEEIHPNCSRHVHRMTFAEVSPHTPGGDGDDVGKADWLEVYAEVLPDYMKPKDMA